MVFLVFSVESEEEEELSDEEEEEEELPDENNSPWELSLDDEDSVKVSMMSGSSPDKEEEKEIRNAIDCASRSDYTVKTVKNIIKNNGDQIREARPNSRKRLKEY